VFTADAAPGAPRMPTGLALTLLLALSTLQGGAPGKGARHGIDLDTKTYPQSTAKEAMGSVLKAVADKKFDYLVAHLADPAFVDDRVKRIYAGKFAEQVDDTRARLDPFVVKQLKRFLDEGKWSVGDKEATVTHEDIKDRTVHLVKKGGSWYLEHRFGATK
jgi:hypothetical protein